MKNFRVRGMDIKSREPVAFDAFEARDRDDAISKLNAAGIAAQSVEEVSPPALTPTVETRTTASLPQWDKPVRLTVWKIVLAVALGVLLAEGITFAFKAVIAGVWLAAVPQPDLNSAGEVLTNPPKGREIKKGDRLRDNVYVYDVAWNKAWEGDDGDTSAATVVISNRSDGQFNCALTAQTLDASGNWLAFGETRQLSIPAGEAGHVMAYVTEYRRHSGKIATRRVILSE